MKFILNHNGTEVINLAFVKDFAIERVAYQDDDGDESHANFQAAKAYLAELVDKLNGGTNS